jgi:hypothetical protein
MVVLDASERGLEMRLVMVIDQPDGARDILAAEFLPMFDKLITDYVGDGERTVVLTFFA